MAGDGELREEAKDPDVELPRPVPRLSSKTKWLLTLHPWSGSIIAAAALFAISPGSVCGSYPERIRRRGRGANPSAEHERVFAVPTIAETATTDVLVGIILGAIQRTGVLRTGAPFAESAPGPSRPSRTAHAVDAGGDREMVDIPPLSSTTKQAVPTAVDALGGGPADQHVDS